MNHVTARARMLPAAAVLTLAALLAPLAAWAQDIPSYARPVVVSTDETIHGRIASVDGAFSLSVNDDRGFVDSVELHAGTIINPTGLTLSPGMSVTIVGYNNGADFNANEIDTPYSYSGALPTPVYYGPGYWSPGFDYGYGPSFSLAIAIGGGYRCEHRPFYGRAWDGRRYFGHSAGGPAGPQTVVGERRGFGGERRNYTDEHRRTFTGAVRSGETTHVPSAFAGRSFAGHAESGYSGAAHRSFAQTEPRRTFASPNAQTQSHGDLRATLQSGGFDRGRPMGGTLPGRGANAQGGSMGRGGAPAAHEGARGGLGHGGGAIRR